jgi:hypothetical protein
LLITLIIALPLDQVLQVVVMYSAVQYNLNLILFLIVNKSWGWGERERQYTPWPTQASMTQGPKYQ